MQNRWKRIFNFFKRVPDVFWCVFLFSLLIYILTCARHLTWEHDGADGGDLAICAYTLGIPHPTGYPLYCLLGWLFVHIVPIGEVAFRLNLFSALFAALGAAFSALAVMHASDLIWHDADERLKHFWIPIIAGFSIAFSYSYWSQALIVEVYALNAFFLALITYFAVLFIKSESELAKERIFFWTAFATGLGFTNHMSTLYPFFASLIMYGVYGWVPRWKTFIKGVALFILPLLLYLYLPIRSSMNPLMDWGDPENISGFLWVLLGKQFKRLIFSSLFPQILYRIYSQINLIKQLGWMGLVASLFGIGYMLWTMNRKNRPFYIFLSSVAVLNFIHIANYLVIDPLSFMLPAFMVLAIFASIGAGFILVYASEYNKRVKDDKKSPLGSLAIKGSVLTCFLIPSLMFVLHYYSEDVSKDANAYDYAMRSFSNAAEGSVICEAYYGRSLSLLYYHHVEGMGRDKNITPIYFEHTMFPWGKKNFRQHYPQYAITPDDNMGDADEISRDFILRNYDKVPAIYFGYEFEAPDGYEWKAIDDLFRVVRIDDEHYVLSH